MAPSSSDARGSVRQLDWDSNRSRGFSRSTRLVVATVPHLASDLIGQRTTRSFSMRCIPLYSNRWDRSWCSYLLRPVGPVGVCSSTQISGTDSPRVPSAQKVGSVLVFFYSERWGPKGGDLIYSVPVGPGRAALIYPGRCDRSWWSHLVRPMRPVVAYPSTQRDSTGCVCAIHSERKGQTGAARNA